MDEPENNSSAPKSRWVCEVEGCENGLATGHALHRTSPTGEGMRFRGRCSEHSAPELIDPIANIIERRNHGKDG